MNQSQKGNAMEGGFLMHSSSKVKEIYKTRNPNFGTKLVKKLVVSDETINWLEWRIFRLVKQRDIKFKKSSLWCNNGGGLKCYGHNAGLLGEQGFI